MSSGFVVTGMDLDTVGSKNLLKVGFAVQARPEL